MMFDFGLLVASVFGFGAYEVSVRIVDQKVDWIKDIGLVRYLLYLIVFGGAVVIVAIGLPSLTLAKPPLNYSFSALLGMGLPSTIRLFAEGVTKVFMKRALTSVGGEADSSEDSDGNGVDIPSRVEQIRPVPDRYSRTAYRIGRFFGFEHRL